MIPEKVFEIWAPEASVWSPWAKPVLFTALEYVDGYAAPALPTAVVPWAPATRSAIVVDLPGVDSVATAIALVERGYRPVPLFNGCHGPRAAVDVMPIVAGLAAGAPLLAASALAADAPPAFLLDSRRTGPVPAPGMFDNRWIVLPQDFPSATFLAAHGIGQVLLVRRESVPDDLTHVLLRWQEAGITVLGVSDVVPGERPFALSLSRPSQFRASIHAVLARIGLRRGSAGGFGGLIPLPPPPGASGGTGGRIGGGFGGGFG